jgi:putative DNA modification/repair radical SAM protein
MCHSWSDDGRCISLLKILMSNACIHECAYCVNRCSNDIRRATFEVEELVDLTLNFYRRNYIEGLFLSSGVVRSADHTMERMLAVASRLRSEQFGGYIHLKTIPGASSELVRRAGLVADRLSVNIELPSSRSLAELAPGKRKQDILKPMHCIADHWQAALEERRKSRKAPLFCPAGQSTQLIVGASPESDRHILHLSESLYERYRLKRVYYSAYVPVSPDSRLPPPGHPADLLREHRLYQADWLVRRYGFEAQELLSEDEAFLDREMDPKCAWALRHPERFPVEINRDPYEALLRVPGIGHISAGRIVKTRRVSSVREEDLVRLGVVMKRARFFITCGGRMPAGVRLTPSFIRHQMLPALRRRSVCAEQPDLFEADRTA